MSQSIARIPVVVFISARNSCLSQIAEGLVHEIYGDNISVYSGGSAPTSAVYPTAIIIMKERGVEISHCVPKHMDDIDVVSVDLMVNLSAEEICSNFFQNRTIIKQVHHMFDDPSRCVTGGGTGNDLDKFRSVRDEVESFVRTLYPDRIIKKKTKISFFEKYLSIWVLVCIVVGSLIGYFVPDAGVQLKKAEVFQTSIPIAVLLWVMIFPMLLQIDFAAFVSAAKNPGPIILTTTVNFGIQPFLMYVIALIFFRYIYASIIPSDLANEYLAGCILLGGAPCTAMVFVWSLLVGGNAGYTLMQVAVNDILVLVLYLPTMLLLLDASSIPIPYETIAISVAFFIVAPLILSTVVRQMSLRNGGEEKLKSVIELFKPVTTVGLLATIVLIFIYQGRTIGNKPLHILLIAIPLTIQTLVVFTLTFSLGFWVCLESNVLAPAALISTSNFFELAVAIAISVYGADSGASLATVVGVLVEVPTMLVLVKVCKYLEPKVKQRGLDCDTKCKSLRDFAACKQCAKQLPAERNTEKDTEKDAESLEIVEGEQTTRV